MKVPVSLHTPPAPSPPAAGPETGQPAVPGEDGDQPGNRDSFFCLDLPLGSADPLERLAVIRRATLIRKQEHDAQQLDAIMRQLARTPRLSHFAEHVLAHPRSFALNVSNVPGPRRPVRVLGVPVRALYSLAEIGEHFALRVAVVSLGRHAERRAGRGSDPAGRRRPAGRRHAGRSRHPDRLPAARLTGARETILDARGHVPGRLG